MKKQARNPFEHSIIRNELEKVSEILAAGIDVDFIDGDGRSALIYAAIEKRVDIAKFLIDVGADVNLKDYGGWAALHFSARDNTTEIAKKLLENSGVVDVQDDHGNTPLNNAVFSYSGNPQMISLLLSHGADPDLQNSHGVSARSLAQTMGIDVGFS